MPRPPSRLASSATAAIGRGIGSTANRWSLVTRSASSSNQGMRKESSPGTMKYNRMIDVCSKTHDTLGTELLFFKMVREREEPDGATHTLLISASVDAWRSWEWLRRFRDSGLDPEVSAHSAAAGAFARVGDTTGAERCLKLMRQAGLQPRTWSYAPLLQACQQPGSGGAQRAEELFEEMKTCGLAPDASCYAGLLACYAGEGNWTAVDECLSDMRLRGLQPTGACFAGLINACVRTRDVARAEKLVGQAVREGVEPTLSMLNVLLKVCQRAGDTSSALRWLQDIPRRHGLTPNATSFNTVLAACGSTGDMAKAQETLQQLAQSGRKPDRYSYTTMIQTCAKAKRSAEAEEWLHRMLDSDIEPDVTAFNVTLHACVQNEELGRLWRIFDKMKALGVSPSAATFTTLALPYSKYGDVERVEGILEDSRKAGFLPGVREYSCLFSSYANVWPAPLKKAETAFREMVAAGVEPNEHVLRFLRKVLGHRRTERLTTELGTAMLPPIEPRSGSTKGSGSQQNSSWIASQLSRLAPPLSLGLSGPA
mmetsp:Transcript_56911/g.123138  ORF Transcript_56911/g.123138 Transcript_56911/m.123138 type:complete len:540 (-) Transcript_56911:60-1679(-)